MPDIEDMTPGEILAEASVAEFIKNLGLSIAEAQTALDENSVNQIAHFVEPREGLGGKTLLDLGLSPAFYHYQHADISCSLQLSLRVERDFGLDLNVGGSFGDNSTSSDSSSTSESESQSGSSSSTSHREARVQISMRTQGALQVGGNNFQLQGDSPMARIDNLAESLRSNPASGIQRVLPTHECAPVNPTAVPPHENIVTTPNTITFLGGARFSSAIIRISDLPGAPETYTMKTGVSANVPPGANLEAHADAVRAQIQALGYSAVRTAGPNRPLLTVTHRHDIAQYNNPTTYKPEQDRQVQMVAAFLRANPSAHVTITGYTDRTGTTPYNQELGMRRAEYMRDRLLGLGVAAGQMGAPVSRGEQDWQSAPPPELHEPHRIVTVVLDGNSHYYILVEGDASHDIVQAEVAPNELADPLGTGNGFIFVHGALTGGTQLSQGGRRIDIGTHQFPLRGSGAGGHAAHAPESYALNLAQDINANQAAGLRAWATGNVVHVCPENSRFTLLLVTSESRDITLAGTDDVTVTTQFSRSRQRDVSTQRTGNRTVAVAASVGIRFQKQFEMNVTGNSTISARLVSIPAPPEFLATIKEFLS